MKSAPGEYHGFLWFFFINEQLLRFLNLRYPRDYDMAGVAGAVLVKLESGVALSVERLHLPGAFRLSYKAG